ncbi:unnamed protein product [Blepharisma stoltei]|uniref:G-protein coupled receptors family 2 profile 2 domain-containing protein n=1 Tax=Blepharisma stoltei TaxID=1481888 RepID=A0AAU9IE99_9CILI|nr:unnamed protein product [Blepharisma stoltei]
MVCIGEYYLYRLYIINAAVSSLSLLGSMFIITVYLSFKELRVFAFKLVSILSCLDAIHALAFLIPSYDENNSHSPLCQLQSVALTFCTLANVLWTAMIALALYLAVIHEKRLGEHYKWYALIFAVLVPLCISWLPYITDSFGTAQGWCWIDDSKKWGTIWRYSLFYGPLWIVIPFNIIVYFKVIKKIQLEIGNVSEQQQMRKQLMRRLVMYPIILVICFTPVTISRVWEIFVDCPPREMSVISGFFTCINGLLNALVYGMTKSVRESLKSWIFRERGENTEVMMESIKDSVEEYF